MGIYRATPEGKIVYVNTNLAELLGYAPGELKERTFEELICPTSQFQRKKFRDDLENRGYHVGTYGWSTKDGEIIYLREFTLRVEEDGKVYYEGIVENITSLVRACEAEKEAREELILLFNSIPESVIVLSEQQIILDANSATLKLLNKSKEEVIGKKCYELFHGTSSPPPGCPFVEMVKKGNGMRFNEMAMEALDGIYLVNVVPYISSENERKILHFARDITAIYDMEEKLITSLKRYNETLLLLNNILHILLREKDEDVLMERITQEILHVENFESCCISMKNRKFEDRMSFYGCREKKMRVWMAQLLEKLDTKDTYYHISVDGSAIVLPMRVDGRILGYMAVKLMNELNDEELKLLQAIADDIAFTVEALRLEKAHKIAYREIEKNMEDLAFMIDGIRNPLAVIMGVAEVELKGQIRERIIKEVERINRTTIKIDEIWKRSEELRNFLSRE